ncbi:MAG: hypothetical protein KatS3mg035_0740 [Bacteroidia bacterium]|nr:MAG: hypothetical protein KatS3mg035_0740 [Bacteroidia bacterium]
MKANKPELSAWLLENNLITKGLMFYSTTQLRRKVEQSGDKNLLSLYEQWLSKRKEVSKAYEMGEAKRKEKNIRIEVLLQEADELEKQISAGLAQKGIQSRTDAPSKKLEGNSAEIASQ